MITLLLCSFITALAYTYGRRHGYRGGFEYAANNCYVCTSFSAMDPEMQALFLKNANSTQNGNT